MSDILEKLDKVILTLKERNDKITQLEAENKNLSDIAAALEHIQGQDTIDIANLEKEIERLTQKYELMCAKKGQYKQQSANLMARAEASEAKVEKLEENCEELKARAEAWFQMWDELSQDWNEEEVRAEAAESLNKEMAEMLRELEDETLCWHAQANYELDNFKDVHDQLLTLLARIEGE